VAKRKNKAAAAGFDPNGWMVTFSDLVTLMLTFFVMLLSMSTMDIHRIQKILSSFTGGAGVLEFTDQGAVSPYEEQLRALNQLSLDQLPRDEVLLDVFLGLGDPKASAVFADVLKDIRIRRTDKEVALVFGAAILFDPGQAEVKPKALPVLKRLAEIINQVKKPVSIDGHTDSRPLKDSLGFTSNWDLSLARAMTVRDILVEKMKANPQRMRVGAMAYARPLADNETAEGRALNRRIEVVFKWHR